MKSQYFFPARTGDQVRWLENYGVKLPIYGPTLGLTEAEIAGSVNDALWMQYVFGSWLSAARAFTPATTDAAQLVASGQSATPVSLPTFTAPQLPPGVVPALPGTKSRILAMVNRIKRHPRYTKSIGSDLGIEGASVTEHPVPRFIVKSQRGVESETVTLTFYKYNHEGVYIEGRRGSGEWEVLGIDTESPFTDTRPLLNPAEPEVREYRMRFWDKGMPNGEWTEVAKITVAP